MRRSLSALLTAALAVPVLGVALATPSAAATLDSFTLSPATASAGTTVTVTASWTSDSNTPNPTDLTITLPPALDGVATWTSASGVSSSPTSSLPCVTDNPPSTAGCLWRPTAAGQTATVTAVLSLGADAAPGTYQITAKESSSPASSATLTVLSDATPAIALSRSSAEPGTSVTATGTFTALTTGDIAVTVDLLGTAGNGTFGTPTSTTGLTGCVMDAALRSLTCTWTGATIGDTRSIVIPVQVAAGTPAGSSFTVEACSNRNTAASRCASTDLSIVTAATPTPTPPDTPTPTDTPTATDTPRATSAPDSPSTTSNGAGAGSSGSSESGTAGLPVALPTAVPAGKGPLPVQPAGSPSPWLWAGILAAIAAAGGVTLQAARRSAR